MNFNAPPQKSYSNSNMQSNQAESYEMAEARETLESNFSSFIKFEKKN